MSPRPLVIAHRGFSGAAPENTPAAFHKALASGCDGLEFDLRLTKDGRVEPFKQAVKRMVVASVGPIASERLRSHGLPVDLEPSHPKMGTLVKETAEQAGVILKTKRSS